MEGKMRLLGSLTGFKRDVADKLAQSFGRKYPSVEGEMYLGYPIYYDEVSGGKVCVDIALISKIGVFIINILTNPVTDYGEIQDDIYAKVESKFKKQPFLFKRKKLIFDFQTITYCEGQMDEQAEYLLAKSNNDLMECIKIYEEPEEFSDDLYGKILSGIQEAYGINNHVLREGINEGTKAYAINQMASLVEKYGNSQMEAILSDVEGIQRIRGMAGSGKTIVLARKAAELHTAHPDWDIVVTYSTRSLKGQLENLISRFYANKNDGAKYNSKKLNIMQAWGSSYSHGVYYEICLMHGVSPLSYTDARATYGRNANLFSNMCADLLKEIGSFKKMYDCILIDEAQDFDKNFLQLCCKIIGPKQRLVYAYDELQSLNEGQMPSPEDIFGHGVENDTPLIVCYRNQGPVIVTAHAIGMGLYRKEGLVQLPGSADVWPAIGYITDEPIEEGKEATLYRTKETSPDFLNVEKSEIIKFNKYKDAYEMFDALFETISEDTTKEQLTPMDIMIIDLDTLSYSNNYSKLITYLNAVNEDRLSPGDTDFKFRIHTAGAASPEDFFRNNSIVYSSVRRAKGNESFMVYVVNAQKCVNTLQRRTDRNALFTAITRSKGWVRVLGFGEDMQVLCDEFERIKEYDFKLYFEHYPTKAEQQTIFLNNQDVEGRDKRAFDQTKELINRLSQGGSISKVQLMKQLFDADTEELLQLLQESEDE